MSDGMLDKKNRFQGTLSLLRFVLPIFPVLVAMGWHGVRQLVKVYVIRHYRCVLVDGWVQTVKH